MKELKSIVLLLLLAHLTNAQNLVPNPSFEAFGVCNGFNSSSIRFHIPNIWYSPLNFNLPHYFNACANATTQQPFGGVPANQLGNQTARTGVAYAAITTYQTSTTCEFRQYIQSELTQTLLAGQEVYFEMWVSLCDNSQLASDGFQVVFTNNRFRPSDTSTYNICFSRLNASPQIIHPQNSIITDASGWTKVSGTYTAVGGERWITIGNFKSNATTGASSTSAVGTGTFPRADYYIDDVMVTVCGNLPQRVLPNDTNLCGASLPLNFQLNAFVPSANSYLWNNGHSGSTFNVVFPGTYTVRVTSGTCTVWDTIVIQNTPKPTVNLGLDRFVCNFTATQLIPSVTNTQTYRWQNNANTPTLTAFFPGIYWLEVTSIAGCKARDSLRVTQSPPPVIQLQDTNELCSAQPLTLNAYFPGATYLWSNGKTDSIITTTDVGKMWVVVNNNGCIRSDTTYIIRNQLSESQLPTDTLVCANTQVLLNANISGAQSYLWSNGSATPSIVATQPGVYSIKATRGNCNVVDTVQVNWKPNPQVNLGNDTTLCQGNNLLLTAGNAGAMYLWNTGSTAQAITANTTGMYKVTVTNQGCSTSDSLIVVYENQPIINLGDDTTLCEGASVTLNATCIGCSYVWQNGITTPIVQANQLGWYKVVVNRGSCRVTDSVLVTVQPKPNVNLGPDIASCFNTPVNLIVSDTFQLYMWSNGSVSHQSTITDPGSYWVRIAHNNCESVDTITIIQLPQPTKPLGDDRNICYNESVVLNAQNAGSTYQWDDGSTNGMRNAVAPGSYWLKITNSVGCFVFDTLNLDTFARTEIRIPTDTFYCANSEVQLTPANVFAAYTWSTGSNMPAINVNMPGIYQLQATDSNGCVNKASITVAQQPVPVPLLTNELKVCEPSFDFYAAPGMSAYMWSDGSTQPYLRINEYGTYAVSVTDTLGCVANDVIKVINNCPAQVYVPNAFTPNRDGINDAFLPVTNNVASIYWCVVDRWGNLIFETDKLNVGWDGSVSGELALSDVYVYYITYTGNDGNKGVKRGNVTLLK